MKRWADLFIIICAVSLAAFGCAVIAAGLTSAATNNAGYLAVLSGDGTATVRNPEIDIAYSDFIARVDHDDVTDVMLEGPVIVGHLRNGQAIETYAPDDPALIGHLRAHRVRVSVAAKNDGALVGQILKAAFPLLFLLVACVYVWQMRSARPLQEDFGKSRARLIIDPKPRLTLADVAGADEACSELAEIVDFLRYPAKFSMLGARIPNGCLLVGPPGTGKTLLARAVAGEANVPFFAVSGSDFVEMYVGVGASRVRDMFAEAKSRAPAIIFIDEIDAVGHRRSAGGHDEREQTLDQLLVELDGIEDRQGVIVLAATNRPEVLDPALLRPGRFDRQVFMPNPDVAGRARILMVHLRNVPLAADVDVERIARGTPGFSGADLANLINEAALRAARRGQSQVTMNDLETAKQKILLGPERRSLVMSEDERARIAYHESGHALVAEHIARNDPICMMTILPRGTGLGVTLTLPEADRHGFSKQEIEARIATLFGGLVAVEILRGPAGVTSGAADDIHKATELARRMVTEFGFNDTLGPLCLAGQDGNGAPGQAITRRQNISKATAAVVDREIRRILRQGESMARAVLTRHRDELDRLARTLLERETLSGPELRRFLGSSAVARRPLPSDGANHSIAESAEPSTSSSLWASHS